MLQVSINEVEPSGSSHQHNQFKNKSMNTHTSSISIENMKCYSCGTKTTSRTAVSWSLFSTHQLAESGKWWVGSIWFRDGSNLWFIKLQFAVWSGTRVLWSCMARFVWNSSRLLAALLWRLVYGRGPLTVCKDGWGKPLKIRGKKGWPFAVSGPKWCH